MNFADHSSLKKSGRSFDCATCPEKIQKLRRCGEDRFDFDTEDGAIWPMRISEGGTLFGFCPGKATWDKEAGHLYNIMVLSYETKQLLYTGGIAEQPGWYIDLLSWFVIRYDENKFYSRATAILGSGKKGQDVGVHGTRNQNNGRSQRS